jgi:hypothetical protein
MESDGRIGECLDTVAAMVAYYTLEVVVDEIISQVTRIQCLCVTGVLRHVSIKHSLTLNTAA